VLLGEELADDGALPAGGAAPDGGAVALTAAPVASDAADPAACKSGKAVATAPTPERPP